MTAPAKEMRAKVERELSQYGLGVRELYVAIAAACAAVEYMNLDAPAPPEPKAEAQPPILLVGDEWEHGCDAACAQIKLWIDRCPHCGKPREPSTPAASVGAVPVEAIGRIVENARPDLGYPYPFKRADDCEAVRSWLSSLDQPKARAEGADVEPCPFCGEAAEVRTDKPSRPPEYMTDREAQANGLGVSGGWLNLPVTEASCRACGVMRVPLSIWNKRSLPAPAPKASAATREAVYNAELFLHDSACKWLCSDDPLGECNCERRAVVMALRRALGIGDF